MQVDPQLPRTCQTCHGKGTIPVTRKDGTQERRPCPVCRGAGKGNVATK